MSAAYPTPSAPWSAARPRPPSAQTAETLVLVALILQVIGGAFLFLGIAFLLGLSIVHPFAYAAAAVGAVLGVGAVVVVFLYLAYTLAYERIQRGEYEAARTPTLVIGILSLFAGILPGVFYLLGYVKLGDALQEQQRFAAPGGPGAAYPGGPGAPQVACRGCGRVHPLGAFAYCPACGQKLPGA